jgi:TRAP-type C4-dicarboxylate transport system substrate-binding protein
MPWPDVPVALKQGVITGLDHTLTVCNVTKKFEVAKYFTQINYAQGLFIWIFNKAWLTSLPADLRDAFVSSVHDVCAKSRIKSLTEENTNIEKAKAAGVEFFQLSDADMKTLKQQSQGTYDKYAPEINKLYSGDMYQPDNFLNEVQESLK